MTWGMGPLPGSDNPLQQLPVSSCFHRSPPWYCAFLSTGRSLCPPVTRHVGARVIHKAGMYFNASISQSFLAHLNTRPSPMVTKTQTSSIQVSIQAHLEPWLPWGSEKHCTSSMTCCPLGSLLIKLWMTWKCGLNESVLSSVLWTERNSYFTQALFSTQTVIE